MDYGIVMSVYRKKSRKGKGQLHARRREPEQAKQIYPFRILAVFLMIGILIELVAILQIPDYSDERQKARQERLLAEAEYQRLLGEIEAVKQKSAIEQSAREQGYTYYGETIFIPVFDDRQETD